MTFVCVLSCACVPATLMHIPTPTHPHTHLVSLGSKAQNVIEDMGYCLLMYILCRGEGGRREEGVREGERERGREKFIKIHSLL